MKGEGGRKKEGVLDGEKPFGVEGGSPWRFESRFVSGPVLVSGRSHFRLQYGARMEQHSTLGHH